MTLLTFKRGDTWKARFYLYDNLAGERQLVLAPLGTELPAGEPVDLTTGDAALHIRDYSGTLVYSGALAGDISFGDDPANGFIFLAADASDTAGVGPDYYLTDMQVELAGETYSSETLKVRVVADITYV